MATLYTHKYVDLDAVASVWAARRFAGMEDAGLLFVPANWSGDGMAKGDMAVDLEAGGRGIKGRQDADGKVSSAFAEILGRYAPNEARAALAHVALFIDAQDAHGQAVKYFLRPSGVPDTSTEDGAGALEAWRNGRPSKEGQEVLSHISLAAVFRAVQAAHSRDDLTTCDMVGCIFDGFLELGLSKVRAEKEAATAQYLAAEGGWLVGIIRDAKEPGVNGLLFDRGCCAVVYVDGHNIGVVRRDDVTARMDEPGIRAIVEAVGEIDEWFAHPAGFLFCRGSRKSLATSPSRVDRGVLAEAVSRAIVAPPIIGEM